MSTISPQQYDEALQAIAPAVAFTLKRAPAGFRFTTTQFVRALREQPEGDQAYQRALSVIQANQSWGSLAGQVLHGQIIPDLLRSSGQVRFAGFAHDAPPGDDDGLSVPSWWLKLEEPAS
jgi:hypothetical protein